MEKEKDLAQETAEDVNETAETAEDTAEKKPKKRKGKTAVLEEKLAQKQEEFDALNDRYLRLNAEFDNFRKRTQKEKEALYLNGSAAAIEKFLGVMDNLERAAAACEEDSELKKGVEMTISQFGEVLAGLDVKEVDPLNEPFDATYHNAIMHVDDDEAGENTVVEVYQKGYTLGERVLRFAVVKVAN